MLDTTEWNYNIGYVNCGSTLIGSKVEITFDSDNGDFQLCKIGVFGADNATEEVVVPTCTTEEASSVTLQAVIPNSTTYDLVAGPVGTINKPTADSLVSCTITWNAYLADGSDLSVTYPTLFEMATDGNLTLKGAVNDVDERQTLYNLNGYIINCYFEGTLNDTGATKLQEYFVITFEDPCLAASVQAPTLNLGSFDWNESGVRTDSSMLDTQEVSNAGTCGVKEMSLTDISPATMPLAHIEANNYNFADTSYIEIVYNPDGADASYAGADGVIGTTYTVDYDIVFEQYDPGSPVMTGSFTFTVVGSECSTGATFDEDSGFGFPVYPFDLQNETVLTIALP